MSKMTTLMENRLMPMSQKISSNKYLVALRDGLMLSMPILIFGSMCIVIGDFPIPAFHEFMSKIFGDIWSVWCWDVAIPATIGLVSLYALIGVAYSLANENKVEPLPAVAISISAYFILLHQVEGGGFAGSDFDAKGLFAAMLTAIVVTNVYSFIIKKNWIIKMPEAVPSFVSRQFTALTPAFVLLPIFLIIRFIFAATSYVTLSNFIIEIFQAPLVNMGTTLVGTLIVSAVNSVLWFFGIHGTAVVDAIMGPVWYAARFENLEVFKAGVDAVRPFIATQDFANHIIFLGGTGNTIGLSMIMIFRCKSKRIRSLGKLAIVPGIFNVNEPVIFGLPLVLNPIMAIPFFLAPTVSVVISYASMFFGLVPLPTGVTVPWTMPAPFAGWMMCNSWEGGALQIVLLIVTGLIYYPFITSLDKQYVKEEVGQATQKA